VTDLFKNTTLLIRNAGDREWREPPDKVTFRVTKSDDDPVRLWWRTGSDDADWQLIPDDAEFALRYPDGLMYEVDGRGLRENALVLAQWREQADR